MKFLYLLYIVNIVNSRSRKGAWIEIGILTTGNPQGGVAPVRERGLKLCFGWFPADVRKGRSRKGAWIEILRQAFMLQRYYVAPVRERGLKYYLRTLSFLL